MRRMPITAVLGEQRGDEGKGRFVDMLAAEHDIVARFNGGANAGHTVVTPEGAEFDLHLMPSGITQPGVMNVIGNGTAIDAPKLVAEIETSKKKGLTVNPDRLMISSAAHLLLPHHVVLDTIREGGKHAQGSTKSGIAQVYADKYMRSGIRAEIINNDPDRLYDTIRTGLRKTIFRQLVTQFPHIFPFARPSQVAQAYVESAQQLAPFITDTTLYLNTQLQAGAGLLAEGAQAYLLDADHGMFPAVTSSSTTVGGIFTGLGVSPHNLDRVIGVSKAIPSHVGGGPFATEIHDDALLEQIHGDMTTVDAEKGTTTGRVRRLGHLDIPAIRRAQMVNGTTEMALTKLDWVPRYGEQVLLCVAYERKGNILDIAPDAAYKIEQSRPIYEALPTWQEDISGIRDYGDLPTEARAYIERIESLTGKPITMIGVGYKRDQVIDRRAA
jgi:adenylosuccinate synthase